jgi:hypothetical protein
MIISEKQIMQLMDFAHYTFEKFNNGDWWHEEGLKIELANLLDKITTQQSEQLKEIE